MSQRGVVLKASETKHHLSNVPNILENGLMVFSHVKPGRAWINRIERTGELPIQVHIPEGETMEIAME